MTAGAWAGAEFVVMLQEVRSLLDDIVLLRHVGVIILRVYCVDFGFSTVVAFASTLLKEPQSLKIEALHHTEILKICIINGLFECLSGQGVAVAALDFWGVRHLQLDVEEEAVGAGGLVGY